MNQLFPGFRLPVAPLLAGAAAKVPAALSGQEPPEPTINSEDWRSRLGSSTVAGRWPRKKTHVHKMQLRVL